MRIYRTWWHTKYDLKVHLIRCPKYRKRILQWKIWLRLREIIKMICNEEWVKIITGKVASDHVHLFISYEPKVSISKVMQMIKWWSSHKIFQEYPELRKTYYGWNFWSRWYMAVSSWSITDEMIQDYIENQEWEYIQWDIEFES
jgi:putative transposase